MNKLGILVVAIIFSVIGFAGGTYYGFKEGINNLALLSQIHKSVVSRYQLEWIEKDGIEIVADSMELDIDMGLHRYFMYQDSGNKILSDFFMPEMTENLDEYIDRIAEYRKDHPIVFNPELILSEDDGNLDTKKWKEQSYKESVEMLSQIKQVLKSRGVSESPLTSQSTQTQ